MSHSQVFRQNQAYQESKLSAGLKWSIAGHFALFFAVMFKGLIFPDQIKPYTPTLKVDLVALPDVLKKDLVSPKQSQLNTEIASTLKKAEVDANRIKTTRPAPPERNRETG